jgi:hypothetical protein
LRANDIISELQSIKHIEKKRELYDRIQIQYNDALKLVQGDLKKTKEKENDYRNLSLLEEYLVYTMIEQTSQRNQEMANDLEVTLQQAGMLTDSGVMRMTSFFFFWFVCVVCFQLLSCLKS